MSEMATCTERLNHLFEAGRHVCVGLDSDVRRLPTSLLPEAPPAQRVAAFNEAVIEATAEVACAFKPNSAFYEALGAPGFEALAGTIAAAKRIAPEVPIILDAKRADIGNTNTGYVRSAFEDLGADAITVHPYLGREALQPFLDAEDKLIFVLARTSNPGAGEFQDLLVDGVPLYRQVARGVAASWNKAGNCGLVVGATYPDEMAQIRADIPAEMPILIPGVGAQGGDLTAVVKAQHGVGSSSFLINASRSIIFASDGADFAAAARTEALRLDAAIRAV
jgi:orotidine-5'-phosphate decarboxylase